ncbi:zinc knuckle CX2CX4HX4C containing protein [Tanacetum coccineum]
MKSAILTGYLKLQHVNGTSQSKENLSKFFNVIHNSSRCLLNTRTSRVYIRVLLLSSLFRYMMGKGSRDGKKKGNATDTKSHLLWDVDASMNKRSGNLEKVLEDGQNTLPRQAFRASQDEVPGLVRGAIVSDLNTGNTCILVDQVSDPLHEDITTKSNNPFGINTSDGFNSPYGGVSYDLPNGTVAHVMNGSSIYSVINFVSTCSSVMDIGQFSVPLDEDITKAGNVNSFTASSYERSSPSSYERSSHIGLERTEITCDNVADFFGVSLTSIKDIDDLTRRIEAGACEDVLGELKKDERNAIIDVIIALFGKFLGATSDNVYSPNTNSASDRNISTPLGTSPEPIQSLLEKFSADMSNLADISFRKEQIANEDIGYVPSPDIPIVQSVSIPKLVSYAGVAGASFDVPKRVVEKNWDKYGLTRLMMKSKGFLFFKFESRKGLEEIENRPWMIHNSPIILKKWTMSTSLFKEELTHIPMWVKLHDVPIQVFSEDGISLITTQIADAALKDNVTMGIPLRDGEGFTKETIQLVKPTLSPIKQKVRYEPKANENFPKNEAPMVSISAKDDPSKKLHAKKESEEEAEVVYDETIILKSTKRGASPSMAPDGSNT